MFRTSWALCLPLALALWTVQAADVPSGSTKLTAAQIAEKNSEVRGGLKTWRAVQSMTLRGKLTAGGNQRGALPTPPPGGRSVGRMVPPRPVEEVQLPFVMELKRPKKMRFELQFNGETALQVSDGTNGWKLRPFLNRREVEPYTAEEAKIASAQAELDGPLMDYAAKGTRIELAGMEKVENRDNYKLKLTMKDGHSTHVWIDAQTFLETKIEGQPRRLDGTYHQVEIYYRDYHQVNGLQIPYLMETKVLPVAKTALGFRDAPLPAERTIIESVMVNPNLDDTLFAKPVVQVATNITRH